MATTANPIPAETDLLCEKCGYILNGLQTEANCPECGSLIASSTVATPRKDSTWETPAAGNGLYRFIATSSAILLRPTHFFKNVTARGQTSPAHRLAQIHWGIASVLFALCGWFHAGWYNRTIIRHDLPEVWVSYLCLTWLIIGCYAVLSLTTRLAARLTAWEAAYRGYRLPMNVVKRALYFHAVHYLPVSIGSFALVYGYTALQGHGTFSSDTATTYLYILSGWVIVAAFYLFSTYWIGMRNLMYANV